MPLLFDALPEPATYITYIYAANCKTSCFWIAMNRHLLYWISIDLMYKKHVSEVVGYRIVAYIIMNPIRHLLFVNDHAMARMIYRAM